MISASLSALAMVASGCSGSADAEPTPSFASSTADAEPSPDFSEPPYETELNLTTDEERAADDAYDVLLKFISAYNQVSAESGSNPERVLRFTGGELYEDHSEGWAEVQEEGERSVGGVVHLFHHLEGVEISGEEPGSVQFESCVDYSKLDLLDRDGNSVADPEREPKIALYELRDRDSTWKLEDIEFTDESCGA